MSTDSPFSTCVALPLSQHQPVPCARQIGKTDGARVIRVSVILKRKTPLDLEGLEGRHLSREEYAEKYSASKDASDAVRAYAKIHGLTVDEQGSSLVRRRVELRGTISAFNQAFGVAMHDYEPEATSLGNDRTAKLKTAPFHAFTGMVSVPTELVDSVQAVLGLDNRPIATPKYRYRPAAAANDASFTPPQVAQVYNFPTAGNGAGQTIGIIELGGGYKTADITNYFQQLGLTVPKVTAVLLDGGTNAPGDANGADGEVMLDIEVAGAVAPGAKIVVYFTTNTDQGFQDAISSAIHDTTNNPSVISISWGGPESSWAKTAMESMDTTCQSAAALGISITVASGDSGSSDGGSGDNVDFPASSPNVLACGGTALTANGSKRQAEVVWNDQSTGGGATGGGYSTVFAVPSYQTGVIGAAKKPTHKKHSAGGASRAEPGVTDGAAKATATGRGVPDVAGDASPESGFQVLVDGQKEVVGGTSAVAPLWAGLIALLNQQLGRNVGFLNPQIYPLKESPFFDVTSGTNGDFSAAAGWDPCTGLGTPDGQRLLAALQKDPAAN